MKAQWIGEAHTDQPYAVGPLSAVMLEHALQSAMDNMKNALNQHGNNPPELVALGVGEVRSYALTLQCLHTPGDTGVPDTVDVTCTIEPATFLHTTASELRGVRHRAISRPWWKFWGDK